MALFSNDTKKTAKVKQAHQIRAEYNDDGRLAGVLKAPWLSEKALIGTEKGVYVFEVPPEANKFEIAAAIELLYKVTPKKIRVANLPGKTLSLRNRRGVGTRARRHKAYVYLNEGDTIQFA
jgi:large subunit ribosomal protein L23